MRRNYRPIRSLGRLSKSLVESSQGGMDDIEAAKLAITTIHKHNADIMHINNRLRRNNFLLDLLRGVRSDPQELSEQAFALGVYLEGPLFRVAILHYGKLNYDAALIDTASRYLESSLSAGLETYVVDYSEDNSVIALLSGGNAEIEDSERQLREASDRLSDEIGYFRIGVSRCYSSIEQSHTHYQQALAAAKYHAVDEGQAVVCYKVSSMSSFGGEYPSDGLAALYNAILTGDTARIEFAVDMLLPYFRNMASLFFTICLGYDIVNTALRAMRELDYPYFEFSRKYPELLLKSRFDSTDEIIQIVRTLSMEICMHINQADGALGSNEKEADNIGAVLGFIQDNYSQGSFSAKTLADHFGMSISNLSHYFKNRTGKVVSSYIATLRLERVKELLRTTDLTVAEIASESGYCHVCTLMRQFKASESTTPHQYRSQYRTVMLLENVKA
jgi:AraC-like DNA-binding protein